MTWKIRLSSIAATALVACGGSSGGGSTGGGTLTVTASQSAVVANGSNSVIIHVDGSQKGPIVARTDRGHFLESGGVTASNPVTPFDVTLVTCNSQIAPTGCVGSALVSASDQNLASGKIQVRFVGVEICGNGIDDDGNGLIDCADPACAPGPTTYCGAAGAKVRMVCTAGVGGAPNFCGCPSANPADCVDCTVAANAGLQCRTSQTGIGGATVYGACTGGACTCTGSGKETSCGDGIDNNCNGLIDCDDPDCQPVGATPGGTCDALGNTCSTKSGGKSTCSVCSGNGGTAQTVETSCGDSKDNDCNGQTDCADAACAGQPCDLNGRRCIGSTCTCQGGGPEICYDGLDNDCNGLRDCADSACQGATPTTLGQACDQANPTYRCTNVGTTGAPAWICKDATSYAITVTASPATIPADGLATATVTALVQDTTTTPPTPVGAGKTVTFTASPLGGITASALTDPSGTATATFSSTSITSSGQATVTATYPFPQPGPWTGNTAQHTIVTLPQLSSMSLLGDQSGVVMGARGSGYMEQIQLTFHLLDSTNATYPAGLSVSFEHQPLQGSYIGTVANCTLLLCTATGVTDVNGNVSVLLHSGQTAGVVSVTAKAQAGSAVVVQYAATNIAIVGAKASGAEINISCSPRNIPALTDQDCTNSNYAGSTDSQTICTVTLADRYKNALGVPTKATFQTEAGIAGLPATTPAYVTSQPPSSQIGLGVATDYVRVTGAKLPADVTPFIGEYSVDHDLDGCGMRTHNPRDGLVTIIVKVRGEEGFVDGSNGCPRDGVYNLPGSSPGCLGEYFIDIGEPFVDWNDNGIQDGDEPYEDLNGNGVWDGPNGVWDADTTIWAQTRILYTGYVTVASTAGDQFSRFYPGISAGPPPAPPAPTTMPNFLVFAQNPGPPIIPATSDYLPVFFTDKNFNIPNYRYAYPDPAKSPGANLTVAWANGGVPTTLDGLGMNFRQLYCSTQTPSNIATQCASSCNWAPCYTVIDVGAFQYGAYGGVVVSGGTLPDGPVCVQVTGSLTTTTTAGSAKVDRTIGTCGSAPIHP
jgi:hypothetical protein